MYERFCLWFVLVSTPVNALAVIFTVPGDFPTIQEAIDAAWPGDAIEVLPGTFQESIDFLGKDIIIFASGGPGETIIDADGLDRAVTFQSGETSEAVLSGFTLCNGFGWPGGGILITNNSSPEISNCIIKDCFGYNNGGAICIENSAPLIIGNVLMDNDAFSGPTGYGGAIYSFQSEAFICGNLITGNDAENGSALFLSYDSSLITNNLIVNNPNTYFDPRGTIYCDNESETVFTNNTIADNAEEAFYGDGSQMTISNCILWGNGPVQIEGSFSLSYSDIQGGYPGTGNISDTPCFIPGSLSDYHLNPDSSPCIDAGNPAPEFNDPEDPSNPGFALWPALGYLHNDMGVYGGGGVGYWVSIDEEYQQVENAGISMHLSSNPFSSSLSIEYSLYEPGEARLSVYDLSGREIAVLVSEFLTPGNHNVAWNPNSRVPDGCYLIILDIYGETEVITTVKLP